MRDAPRPVLRRDQVLSDPGDDGLEPPRDGHERRPERRRDVGEVRGPVAHRDREREDTEEAEEHRADPWRERAPRRDRGEHRDHRAEAERETPRARGHEENGRNGDEERGGAVAADAQVLAAPEREIGDRHQCERREELARPRGHGPRRVRRGGRLPGRDRAVRRGPVRHVRRAVDPLRRGIGRLRSGLCRERGGGRGRALHHSWIETRGRALSFPA